MSGRVSAIGSTRRVRGHRPSMRNFSCHPFPDQAKIFDSKVYLDRLYSLVKDTKLRKVLEAVLDLGLTNPKEISESIHVQIDDVKMCIIQLQTIISDAGLVNR